MSRPRDPEVIRPIVTVPPTTPTPPATAHEGFAFESADLMVRTLGPQDALLRILGGVFPTVDVTVRDQRLDLAGPVAEVLERPLHPYTMGLTHAFPDITGDEAALVPIRGAPPSLLAAPEGCRFAPRCPFAEARCRSEYPPLREHSGEHVAACWRAEEAAVLRGRAARPATWLAA